ncbi:hypothetical protein [Pseudoalteromonas phenolica]|uniref:hypothetical protein n=1 Tax=Pseudoalteromonas phenolica TaxID=161398 RepID=UPI00384AC94D
MTEHTNWLVYKFTKAGEHFFVHLVDPSKLNLDFGFLKDSIKALQDPKAIKVLPFTKWLELPSYSVGKLPPVGKIFHVARCGSTLLCQNLKATGKFITLGEPEFLGRIYNPSNMFPEPFQTLASLAAKKAVADWNLWANSLNKQLIIKFNSVSIMHQSQIRSDFPDSPVLCLIREPLAVLESLTRTPPDYVQNQAWLDLYNTALPDLNTQPADAMAHYAGKHYFHTLTQMEQHSSGHSNTKVYDYTELSNNYAEIVSFLSTNQITAANQEWNNTWSSKEGVWKSKPYKAICNSTLNSFAEQHDELLKALQSKYAQLKTLPIQHKES